MTPRSTFTERLVPTPNGRGEVQDASRIRHQYSGESLVSSAHTEAAARGISNDSRITNGAELKNDSSTGSSLKEGAIGATVTDQYDRRVSDPEVLVSREDTTVVVTLNAPRRRNVLSAAMVDALGSAYDQLEADDAVRCVVLTGAGSAFCAGAELSTLERAAEGDFEPVRHVYDGFLRVLASPLPTIAAVNGPAVGAGFNLALACDIRLAGESARFDTRFSTLRLHPGGGHTWLLTRAVGPQQAALACLFGEVWDAHQAKGTGLVVGVHPDERLVPAAVGLAARLASNDSAYVRRLTATLRQAAGGAGHAEVLAAETEAQAWSLTQPPFRAGLAEIQARIARRG
jgi:enoyl-CoA hydratase